MTNIHMNEILDNYCDSAYNPCLVSHVYVCHSSVIVLYLFVYACYWVFALVAHGIHWGWVNPQKL